MKSEGMGFYNKLIFEREKELEHQAPPVSEKKFQVPGYKGGEGIVPLTGCWTKQGNNWAVFLYKWNYFICFRVEQHKNVPCHIPITRAGQDTGGI